SSRQSPSPRRRASGTIVSVIARNVGQTEWRERPEPGMSVLRAGYGSRGRATNESPETHRLLRAAAQFLRRRRLAAKAMRARSRKTRRPAAGILSGDGPFASGTL